MSPNGLAPVAVDSSEVRRHGKLTCPAFQDFPRNAWYVVACSPEVKEEPLARRVLNTPVVLFRDENGQAVALFDRCPHRGLPLSMGRLKAGMVECRYHGFTFGGDGACRIIPSQEAVSAAIGVPSYPLVERYHWLWTWVGDPARADPSLIPDCSVLDSPDYSARTGAFLPFDCNAMLLLENLLDQTHISFLHPGAFDAGQAAAAPYRVVFEETTIRITREISNDQASLGLRFKFDAGAKLDRTLMSETFAPGLNVIHSMFRDPAHPELGERGSVSFFPITPVGPRACYHFSATANSRAGDPSLPAGYQEVMPTLAGSLGPLDQDKEALEAVQRLFDEIGPEAVEWSVKADAAALRLRQIIAGMAERERATERAQGLPEAVFAAS